MTQAERRGRLAVRLQSFVRGKMTIGNIRATCRRLAWREHSDCRGHGYRMLADGRVRMCVCVAKRVLDETA